MLVAIAAPTSVTLACQPARDTPTRIASNVELVQHADLIVLAKVTDGPPANEKADELSDSSPQIVLTPVKVLKGDAVSGAPLRLVGSLYDGSGKPVRPHPTPLSEAHPNTLAGGCFRYEYAKGALIVAMFRKTEQGFEQLAYPLARSAEDVKSKNSTWVRAVAYYAEATRGAPKDQRRKLFQLQMKLASSQDTQDKEIAEDLTRHLRIRPDVRFWGEPVT